MQQQLGAEQQQLQQQLEGMSAGHLQASSTRPPACAQRRMSCCSFVAAPAPAPPRILPVPSLTACCVPLSSPPCLPPACRRLSPWARRT
jgi:hypothetical protein